MGSWKWSLKISGRSSLTKICLKAEVTWGMFILLVIANSRQDLRDFLRKYFAVQVNYAPWAAKFWIILLSMEKHCICDRAKQTATFAKSLLKGKNKNINTYTEYISDSRQIMQLPVQLNPLVKILHSWRCGIYTLNRKFCTFKL